MHKIAYTYPATIHTIFKKGENISIARLKILQERRSGADAQKITIVNENYTQCKIMVESRIYFNPNRVEKFYWYNVRQAV